MEDIANLRMYFAVGRWEDRWDWIEKDGKVIMTERVPRVEETLRKFGGGVGSAAMKCLSDI